MWQRRSSQSDFAGAAFTALMSRYVALAAGRGDAELVVDEELDLLVVHLSHEDWAIEATDGDFSGGERFFHGFGAVADEYEQAFTLTLWRFDGEAYADDADFGLAGGFEVFDELPHEGRSAEGVTFIGADFAEYAERGMELRRAAGAEAGKGKHPRTATAWTTARACGAGEKAERALVDLEAGLFFDQGGKVFHGVAQILSLWGGGLLAIDDGDCYAEIVGGLYESDGGGALGVGGDGDDAVVGAGGERGGGGAEEQASEERSFHAEVWRAGR